VFEHVQYWVKKKRVKYYTS